MTDSSSEEDVLSQLTLEFDEYNGSPESSHDLFSLVD